MPTRERSRAAAEALLALPLPDGAEARGLVVQRMAPPGLELILGIKRDPQFGPTVVAGLGGVFAEALDDVAIRLAPIDDAEARSMLGELRGARLLDGFRGSAAVDTDALAAQIAALSRLAMERPAWMEVDVNPVIAGPDGAVVVDALIVTSAGDDA